MNIIKHVSITYRKLAIRFLLKAKDRFGFTIQRIALLNRVYEYLWRKVAGDGKITTVPVEGFLMHLDLRDIYIACRLYIGDYEPTETALFLKNIRAGMTVVDIGANIGYYTLLAARFVGNGGVVYAFEPAPASFSLLTQNIQLNNYRNIVTFQRAVSDKRGIATLFLSPRNFGDNRIVGQSRAQTTEVQTVTLDAALPIGEVHVIKMDIQGAEMLALLGMRNVIMRSPKIKILTEFWPAMIRQSGYDPMDFLKKIHNYGFLVSIIHEDGRGVKQIDINNVFNAIGNKKFVSLFLEKK